VGFTLENIGNAPLTVTGTVLTGAAATAFTVDTPPPASVPAGGTATFTVALAPTSAGSKAAVADVTSNDPDQPHYTFAVGGVAFGELRGLWALDETDGQAVADSSGQGSEGTATQVTWVAAHSGNGASFNGTDSYIRVPSSSALNPQTITVAAWIRPVDWQGNRRILQKGAGDDQYRLLAENSALVFDISNVGRVTTALPAANAWTHVAATYDLASVRLYVNGVEVASVASTAAMPETSDTLFIGTKTKGAPAGDHFKGVLDDVRVYGRALTAAEVAALSN